MHRLFLLALISSMALVMALSTPLNLAAMPSVERVVVYKSERVMKLLSGNEVVRSYRIALGRNPVGHKERAGDCRTPEGTYFIDHRNKKSRFYKSLHISYPNSHDRTASKRRGASPGGDIEIHGLPEGFDDLADDHYRLNWTKGCIAVNNAEMDEIWQFVADGTPIVIKP